VELAAASMIYCPGPPKILSDKARKLLTIEAISILEDLGKKLNDWPNWDPDSIENQIRQYCDETEIKLGQVAQPLRAALTGSTTSPGIFEIIAILGAEEVAMRIDAAAAQMASH
jgi:glutamyl-tRNA synthetase